MIDDFFIHLINMSYQAGVVICIIIIARFLFKIIKVPKLSLSVGRKRLSGTTLAFGEGNAKARIKNVLHYKKPAGVAVLMAILLVVLLAVCLLSNPKSSVKIINQTKRIRADNITISYGVSSYAMFGASQMIIDEIIEMYSQMELSPTSYEPELEKQLNVYLVNGIEHVLGFHIDSKGVVTILNRGNTKNFLCRNGSSIYRRIYGIYKDSYHGEGYVSGVYHKEYDLEEEVSQVILSENRGEIASWDKGVEAHTTLQVKKKGDNVTVYAMVLVQGFNLTESSITEEGGSYMPVAITFKVNENGSYTLQEYWRPMDGSYYASSIADRFPTDIYEDAINTQTYICGNMQACYKQVIETGNINTEIIIEKLISEICSSPKTSSAPGDYIKKHDIAYRKLCYLGEYTLKYCYGLFEEGGQDGLKGHIMAIVCNDIKGNSSDMDFATGQEWYDERIRDK